MKSPAPLTEEPEDEEMDGMPLIEGYPTRNLQIGSKLAA